MSLEIEKISPLLKKEFPEEWWKEFDFEAEEFNPPENLEKNTNLFKKKVEDCRDQIFDMLNASVLLGEYAKVLHFDEYLKKTSNEFNIIPSFFPPNNEVQECIAKELNINFIEWIKFAHTLYLDFYITTKLKYSLNNREYILNHNLELRDKFEEHDFSENKNINFFLANIQVSAYDHFYTPETDHLKDLNELSTNFAKRDRLGGNKYSLLLKNKCDFLICKWIVRKQHLSEKSVYIVKNSEITELSPDSFNNSFYPTWKKYIKSHYELDTKWKSIISDDCATIKEKGDYPTFNLLDIHRHIKFYKDCAKNIEGLRKIKELLSEKYTAIKNDKEQSHFTKYSYIVAYMYAINNELSMLVDAKNSSIEEIERVYKEITSFQEQTGIKNFFPQYKYLIFLVKKLESLYNNRKALEFLTPAREIITTCEEIITSYKINVEWSEQNFNYVYQLPYSECLAKTDNQALEEIFIASSFSLPISRQKYIDEFEENKQKVYNLKTSIEIFENIEKDFSEFNHQKEEIKNREVKSMEILGIFTALVTFVAASLPTFKFINTPYQAFLFMLALSTSLGIFVLLILLVSRDTKKIKEHKNIIIALVLSSLVLWSLLVIFTKDPLIKVVEDSIVKTESKILAPESVKTNNKLDSAIAISTKTVSLKPKNVLMTPKDSIKH